MTVLNVTAPMWAPLGGDGQNHLGDFSFFPNCIFGVLWGLITPKWLINVPGPIARLFR